MSARAVEESARWCTPCRPIPIASACFFAVLLCGCQDELYGDEDLGDGSPSRTAEETITEDVTLAEGYVGDASEQTTITEDPMLVEGYSGDASSSQQADETPIAETPTSVLWELMHGPETSTDGRGSRCAAIQVWDWVESQQACQDRAVAAGDHYYQFQDKDHGGLCSTAPYCYDTLSVRNPWRIFKQPSAAVCTCDHGHPAESRYCPSASAKCAWCHDGYSLSDQGLCEPTVLWRRHGPLARTCARTKKLIVDDQKHCQELAVRKRHRFYVYNPFKKKCWTGRYCSVIEKKGWRVYVNPKYGPQPEKKDRDVIKFDWTRPFSHICPRWRESLPHPEIFLRVHNYFRCLHDVEPLLWDFHIEKHAVAAARRSAELGRLAHTWSYRDHWASENLAAGTSPTTANTAWYDEIVLPEYKWPGDATVGATGHFTAMIWKSSTKLGCGEFVKNDYVVHACHYAKQPSNLHGLFAKNVPKTSWVNEPEFCCREAFIEDFCDAECQHQWNRAPPK